MRDGGSLQLNRDGTVQQTVTYTTRQYQYSTTPTTPSGSSTKSGRFTVSCGYQGIIVFGLTSDYGIQGVDGVLPSRWPPT